MVGCSHPGVEAILEGAAQIDRRLYTVIGGFHLVLAPKAEVERTAAALHDTLKLERVAPAHCTSELGFLVLLERFKQRFDRAGVGAVITLPWNPLTPNGEPRRRLGVALAGILNACGDRPFCTGSSAAS